MKNKEVKVTLVMRTVKKTGEIDIRDFSDDQLMRLKNLLRSEEGEGYRIIFGKDGTFGSESYIRMAPLNASYNGKFINN